MRKVFKLREKITLINSLLLQVEDIFYDIIALIKLIDSIKNKAQDKTAETQDMPDSINEITD